MLYDRVFSPIHRARTYLQFLIREFSHLAPPKPRRIIFVCALASLATASASCWRSRAPSDDGRTGPFLTAPPPLVPLAGGPGDDEAAARATWVLDTDDGGTARVAYRGAKVMTFHYLFWGKNYAWADPIIRGSISQGGVTRFELGVEPLGLRLLGSVAKTGPGEVTFDYTLDAKKDLDGIDGGGLEFNLNLDAVPTGHDGPALFSDRRGFQWDAGPGGVTVAFDPPLSASYFDQGHKKTVRCFLVGNQLRAGQRRVVMKIRLPQGGVVRRSADDRYGVEDRSAWYPDTLPWDKWPVDVSFLNDKPAGKHGHVRADGDRLVFEDGTPARFWGTNVQANALFQGKKEDVALQAKRLAALGYNLVRIHHHDSPWVKPNVFDPFTATTQKLDDRALDRIDWWVKCLKDEGIYVWMDLHVGRQFAKGDNVEGFAELARHQGSGKGFNYVNPSIEKLMHKFAEQYLFRTNSYTGKRYPEEPALFGVLLTNENDITFHHGAAAFEGKTNPVHNKLFQGLARRIAGYRGATFDPGLDLSAPGPGKILLGEVEYLFNRRAIEHLRSAGLRALIAPTNFWGAESLSSLPPLASGDIIDVHSYGAAESLGTNPHYEANFIAWIGAAQIAGKPLSITEWNVEYPSRDRFVAPLYVAAVASLQGWDAPMIYGYAGAPLKPPEHPDARSTWNDPALTAVMPAAAVLFRSRHVREAVKTYRLDLTRESLYYERTSPETSVALRTLVEQSKLTVGLADIPELGWDDALSLRSQDAIAFSDAGQDFLPSGQTFVVSDTGELRRDWAAGIETIDAPLSQAALGWLGGKRIQLRDVAFDVKTPKAALAVTSLDGQPIATSRQLLVTAVGQAAASPGGGLPFVAQPIDATLTLRGTLPLRLVPLSPSMHPGGGARTNLTMIEPIRRGAEQIFVLPHGLPTHWFMLVP
jgi:hypothetical protein